MAQLRRARTHHCVSCKALPFRTATGPGHIPKASGSQKAESKSVFIANSKQFCPFRFVILITIMSQPQKKRKWKAYEKKSKKEAAAVVLQSKLKNLDQIFADSSADEDGSNHDAESYRRSADEEKSMTRNKSVRSDIVSASNRLAIKDHSEEQSCSSNSNSSGCSFPPRKQSTYSDDEEKEGQEDSTSENEDSSQPTDEEGDEDSGAEQRNSEDEDEDFLVSTTETTKAENMARAIARILGESSSSNHDHNTKHAVILSKTRTKLQKMQSEALEEKKSLSLKRSERKQNNLSSMYIPPPIHSNSNSNKGYSSAASSTTKVVVVQELQNDRTYRRIATRGVVALFNAIAQHQREQKQEVTAEESSEKKNISTVTSQREFIQKIKESTVTKQQSTQMAAINNVHENKIRSTTNKKSTGWSALKDDYMMSSNNLKVSLSSDT